MEKLWFVKSSRKKGLTGDLFTCLHNTHNYLYIFFYIALLSVCRCSPFTYYKNVLRSHAISHHHHQHHPRRRRRHSPHTHRHFPLLYDGYAVAPRTFFFCVVLLSATQKRYKNPFKYYGIYTKIKILYIYECAWLGRGGATREAKL